MIGNGDGRFLVSCLGWVDGGGIWVFDAANGSTRMTATRGARYVELGEGDEERFTAVHHFGGERLLITVQSFDSPETPQVELEVRGWRAVATGSPDAWRGLPSAYVGHLNDRATGAAGYYLIRPWREPDVSRLGWFDAQTYDLGYQSITSVVEIPETGELLFGVQRSSDLVRCSPDGATVLGLVRLPGHLGNPIPHVRRVAREVWAVDYDTVVRLDRSTLGATGAVDLGQQSFVGDLTWSPRERVAVLGRPFQGDVVVIEAASMTIQRTIATGRQPLDAAVLESGRVVARDWKTGEVLFGT